jgi:hypothetical protein
MSFFKHIGTANGVKKVIIVQRELPGESHMAGVIYSEIIPSRFHDDIMKELESDAGQASNEFKEVLERRFFSDGRNMLETLYHEGFVKKVASNNVIVRPNSKSSIRLDELNKMLSDIRSGKTASKDLADLSAEPSVSAPVVETVSAAAAAAPVDQNALMMQMMQTMQSLQAEIAAIKNGSEPKKGPGRPKKNTAAAS